MHAKQELSRADAALNEVLSTKTAAEQEQQAAQQGAASAASEAAAARAALEEAQVGLHRVKTCVLQCRMRLIALLCV